MNPTLPLVLVVAIFLEVFFLLAIGYAVSGVWS